MSSPPTADASVSVTAAPEIETSVTLTALPAAWTAKRPFPGTASSSSSSLKVSVSVSPSTAAPLSVGAPLMLVTTEEKDSVWLLAASQIGLARATKPPL